MSLWQFSEISQPLFKRCINAATIDNNNKWVKKFGVSSQATHLYEVVEPNVATDLYLVNDDITVSTADVEAMDTAEDPNLHEHEDFGREILHLDPVTHFEYIQNKCLENSSLFSALAKHLPLTSIEKLCNYIFNTQNIDLRFIENFYTYFFPDFLKRESTRLSLGLLDKAKCHPLLHRNLLLLITKDVELPRNILHDFVSTFNSNEKTEFLLSLCQSNIPNNVFIYHLPTIHTSYKQCQKSNQLQNLILSRLKEISESCITDKNFGRFLLNFIQACKEFPTDTIVIESIIDKHRSAFRKSCLNALNNIKKVTPTE